MNSYDIHKKIMTGCNDDYFFKTTKEIFGRKIKKIKFKKWFARYINEKKKHIRRYGIFYSDDLEYFGCKVFRYGLTYPIVFTCKPKSKHAKPYTLNHAEKLKGLRDIFPF